MQISLGINSLDLDLGQSIHYEILRMHFLKNENYWQKI